MVEIINGKQGKKRSTYLLRILET